ncbi:16482_t:CDS:1, partial [Racocetra persica]
MEYTSESDSFVYNLIPIFFFTMNFLDDTWNYNSSTGGRVFDDAIFLGTPF